MAKATVLADLYRYHEEFGDPDSQILEATRGEVVDVDAKELERGLAMSPPGLAKGDSSSDLSPDRADDVPEIPDDLDSLKKSELAKLAQELNVDVPDDATKDTLVAAIAAAPGGHERPQV